jgi:hypothetical protein
MALKTIMLHYTALFKYCTKTGSNKMKNKIILHSGNNSKSNWKIVERCQIKT